MKALKGEKHFTSSVWILTNTSPQKILLIHHKKFGLWLQPGGHIEKFENPIEAAIRETLEETGINVSFLLQKIIKSNEASFLPTPDFLLEETIPAYKNEPAHFHIDIMYLVKVKEQSYIHNKKEAKGIGFFTKKEALALPLHEDSKIIIRKIMK